MSNMTPHMTDGQIQKAVGNYRALLEKHSRNFSSDAVQVVLGNPDFAAAQFKLFRERVEAQSGILIRDFTVDPSIFGMAILKATGRRVYVDKEVVATMPRATVESGKLHFFTLGRYTPVEQLEGEADKRGLTLVDPHTLAAFNTANPDFADTHPNGTQSKDANGNFCCAYFRRCGDERLVSVRRRVDDWNDRWWFAGVCK